MSKGGQGNNMRFELMRDPSDTWPAGYVHTLATLGEDIARGHYLKEHWWADGCKFRRFGQRLHNQRPLVLDGGDLVDPVSKRVVVKILHSPKWERTLKMRQLFDKGLRCRAISRRMGIAETTVSITLKYFDGLVSE
jgi:hypothetical protein